MHQIFIGAAIQLVYVGSIEKGLQLILKEGAFAFGDNLALPETSLSEYEKSRLQFSKSALYTIEVVFII